MWESRVLRRAFERLELHEGKLSRAVLRGGGGGDVTSLPDTWVGNHPGLPGPLSRHHFLLNSLSIRLAWSANSPGTSSGTTRWTASGRAVTNCRSSEAIRISSAGTLGCWRVVSRRNRSRKLHVSRMVTGAGCAMI